MLEPGTDQAKPESQLESESCRTRLLELQAEFRKMEEIVANMIRYKAKVDQLRQENANRKFSYEANLQQYCDQMSTLERDNVLLRHQLKNTESQLHGKGDDQDKVKILLERLKMMEVENSSLVLENEQQRQQYDKCLDEIANQVVQALLAQKTLREECLKLQSRVQDLEIQNEQLNVMFEQRQMIASTCQLQDMKDDIQNTRNMCYSELWLPDCQLQEQRAKSNERSVLGLSLTMPRGTVRKHRYLKTAQTKQLDHSPNKKYAEVHNGSFGQRLNNDVSLHMKPATPAQRRMQRSYSFDDICFLRGAKKKESFSVKAFLNYVKEKKISSEMLKDYLSVKQPPSWLANNLQLMLHSSQTPHNPGGCISRSQAMQLRLGTCEELSPTNSIDRNTSSTSESAEKHRSWATSVGINVSESPGQQMPQICSLTQSSALQTLSDTLRNLCEHPILCEHPMLCEHPLLPLKPPMLSGQNYYYDYSDEESDSRPPCRNASTTSSLSLNEFLDSTSCREFLLDDDLFYDYSTIPKSSKAKGDHLTGPPVPSVSRHTNASSTSTRSQSRFSFSEKSIASRKLTMRSAISTKKKGNNNNEVNQIGVADIDESMSELMKHKHINGGASVSDKIAAARSTFLPKIVSKKINTKMLTGVGVDRTLVSTEKSHSVTLEYHPRSRDVEPGNEGIPKECHSNDQVSWGQMVKNQNSHSSHSLKRENKNLSSRLTSNRGTSSLDQKLTRPGQLILAPEEKNFNFHGFSSGSSTCSEDKSPLKIFESKQNYDMKSSVIEVKKDGTIVHAMNSLRDSSSETTSASNSPCSPVVSPLKTLTSVASKVPRILRPEIKPLCETSKDEALKNVPMKCSGPISTNITVGYLFQNQQFPKAAHSGVDFIKPGVAELKNKTPPGKFPDSQNPAAAKCQSSDSSFENLKVERSGSKDDGYSTMSSDIHPEILEKFADTLNKKLPADCELPSCTARNILPDGSGLQSDPRKRSEVTVQTQNRSFDLMSDPDSALETSLHSTAEMVTSSSSHVSTSSSDFPLSPCSRDVSEIARLLDGQGTDFCLLQGSNSSMTLSEKDNMASSSSKTSNSSPASPNSFIPNSCQPPESPRRLAHEFLKSNTVKCPAISASTQSAPSGSPSKLNKPSEGLSQKQKPQTTGIPLVSSNKQPLDSRPQKPQEKNLSSPNAHSRLPKRFASAAGADTKMKPSTATKGHTETSAVCFSKRVLEAGSKNARSDQSVKSEANNPRSRKQSTVSVPLSRRDAETNSAMSSNGDQCPANESIASSNNIASNKSLSQSSNNAASVSNNNSSSSSVQTNGLQTRSDNMTNKCLPVQNTSANNSNKNSNQNVSVTQRKTCTSGPVCVRLADKAKRLIPNLAGPQANLKVKHNSSQDSVTGCSRKDEKIPGSLNNSTNSNATKCKYSHVKSSSLSSPASTDIPSVHQVKSHNSEKPVTSDLPQPIISDCQLLQQHPHIVLTNQGFQQVSDSDNTEDDHPHCLSSASQAANARDNMSIKNANKNKNTNSITNNNIASPTSNTDSTNSANLQISRVSVSKSKDCICHELQNVKKSSPSQNPPCNLRNNHLRCFKKQHNQNLPFIHTRNQNAKLKTSNAFQCLRRSRSETDLHRKWTTSSRCDEFFGMVWDSGRVLDRCVSLDELTHSGNRSRLSCQCHVVRTTSKEVDLFRLYQRSLHRNVTKQLTSASPGPPSRFLLPLHSHPLHPHQRNMPLQRTFHLKFSPDSHPGNADCKLTCSNDTLDNVVLASDDSPATEILEQKRFNSQFYSLCQVDSHRSLLSSGNNSRETLSLTNLNEIKRNNCHVFVDGTGCSQDKEMYSYKQVDKENAAKEFDKISRQIAGLSKTVNDLGLSLSSLNSDDLEATYLPNVSLLVHKQEHMCRRCITDVYHWVDDDVMPKCCNGECIKGGHSASHESHVYEASACCTSQEPILGNGVSSESCQPFLQEQFNRFLNRNSSGQDEIFARTIFDTVKENPHAKKRQQNADSSLGGDAGSGALAAVETHISKSDFRGTVRQVEHEGGQDGERHTRGQESSSVSNDKQRNEQTEKLASSNNESDDSLASDIGLDHMMCQRLFSRRGHNPHTQSSRNKAVIDATKFFMRYGDSVKEAISSYNGMANLPYRTDRSERTLVSVEGEANLSESVQEAAPDSTEMIHDADKSSSFLMMADTEKSQLETRDVGIDAMSQSLVSLSTCLEPVDQLPPDLMNLHATFEPVSCLPGDCDSFAELRFSANQHLDDSASVFVGDSVPDNKNIFVAETDMASFHPAVQESCYTRHAVRPNSYVLQTRTRQKSVNDTRTLTPDSAAEVQQISYTNEAAPPKLPPRQPIRSRPGFDHDIPPLPPPPACLDNGTLHLSYNQHHHRYHNRQQTHHFPYVNQFIPSLALQNSQIFKTKLLNESNAYDESEFSPRTAAPPLPPRLPHTTHKVNARLHENVQPNRHHRITKRLDERPQSLNHYLLNNASNSSLPSSSHLSSLATYPGPKHHSHKRQHFKRTSSMDKPKDDSSTSRIPRRRQKSKADRSKSRVSTERLPAADKSAAGKPASKQWRDIDVVNGLPLSDSSCEDNNSS